MPYFPIFVSPRQRPIFVFGTGAAAAARLRSLAGAPSVHLIRASSGQALVPELEAEVQQGRLILCEALPSRRLLSRASLVFAATGTPARDRRIAQLSRAVGVLVNAVDQPDVSDFIVPARVERFPLSVAIASAGQSPTLVRRVKAEIEAILPPRIGDLTELLGRLRGRLAPMIPSPSARRRFWAQELMTRSLRELAEDPVLDWRLQQAAARFETEAASSPGSRGGGGASPKAGPLVLNLTGPSPEHMRLWEWRALTNADWVLYEAALPAAFLAYGRNEARYVLLDRPTSRLPDEVLEVLERGTQAVVRLVWRAPGHAPGVPSHELEPVPDSAPPGLQPMSRSCGDSVAAGAGLS